jgi:glycosyltransferase involved in cell wall biosynthesis
MTTSPRILYFGSCHGEGLAALCVDQAQAIARRIGSGVLVVSGEAEQFTGLAQSLRSRSIPLQIVDGLDHHRRFSTLAANLRNTVLAYEPDFVHVQTNWQLALAVAVKRCCRVRYRIIYTVHGYRHNHRFRAQVARQVIGLAVRLGADLVIAPSTFVRSRMPFVADRSVLLFLGVGREWFGPRWPGIADNHGIVCAGQFRTGKNQDMVIRAVARYMDATADSNVMLHLPGAGPLQDDCRSLARSLGVERHVSFPGRLPRADLLKLYLSCPYAVIPTNVETFGSCIAEPMVLGRVVLSRRVGIAQDVITPGRTGFLFDGDNDLAQLMAEVIPRGQDNAAVAEAAFAHRHLFDWDRVTDRYFEILDHVADRSPVRALA